MRVATVWVLFEWIHSWLLTGFPWIFLSHTQYRFLPFIQSADLFGAFGVSFLLAFLQAAGLEAWRTRRFRALAVAGALVALNLGYGVFRLEPAPEKRDGPGVLLVQSAITQDVKQQRTESFGKMLRELIGLTRDGLRAYPDTALIVWAETMHPRPHIEDEGELAYSVRAQLFRAQVARDAKRFGRPAVYGVNSYKNLDQFRGRRGFNSAVLVSAEGEVAGIYSKQRLLPMGEQFMPRLIVSEETADAWFAWLVQNFGYPGSADLLDSTSQGQDNQGRDLSTRARARYPYR